MSYRDLRIGGLYSRRDLAALLNESTLNISREGLYYAPGNTLLFVTLIKTGRRSDLQYNDFFDGEQFHWDSQTNQHIGTPRISQIRRNVVDVHLFARIRAKTGSDTHPFVYCGKVEYITHEAGTSNPVHIIFQSINYQQNPHPSLSRIYNWKPSSNNLPSSAEASIPKPGRKPNSQSRTGTSTQTPDTSSGSGRQMNPKIKKAVERWAMLAARMWYESAGFEVTDTSKNQPYDLLCQKQGEDPLKVEVKGTTTKGENVDITRNELLSAIDMKSKTDLFILYSIKVKEVSNSDSGANIFDGYETSGGLIKVEEDWFPEEERLKPLNFQYTTNPNKSLKWSETTHHKNNNQ